MLATNYGAAVRRTYALGAIELVPSTQGLILERNARAA